MKNLLFIALLVPFLTQAQGTVQVNRADTSRQHFYALLKAYQNGERDYSVMPYLVNGARAVMDEQTAAVIAQDYIANYLLKLEDRLLFTRENVEFIADNIRNSNDKGFHFFYTHAAEVNKVMGIDRYAEDIVVFVLARDVIRPFLKDSSKAAEGPGWKGIWNNINAKFHTDYADRTVMESRLTWYKYKKDWDEYCRYVVEKVEKYGPFGMFPGKEWRYNHCAWDLFLHTSDRDMLTKALSWSDSALKISPSPVAGYIDTYANILYKLGRVQEAINWQESAVAIAPEANDLKETLKRMKKGEPTWPLK